MFEVSDKIVCIDDRGLKDHAFLFTDLPVKGQMYVVRGMDYHPDTLKPDDIPGVLLTGIFGCDCPITQNEYCFNAKRFVPLDEYRKNREKYIRLFRQYEQELPVCKGDETLEELVAVGKLVEF